MPVREASAVWHGNLKEGHGHMAFGSGAYDGDYSWSSRFEEAPGTNPEELLGAAHAGCFSMALSGDLTGAGYPPDSVDTNAQVHIEKHEGPWTVTRIHLTTRVAAPGLSEGEFQELAAGAKANCPVSRALTGVEITLDATLA